MKAKLIVEGKEFEVNINHPELEKLIKPEKKTGYERVSKCASFFYVNERDSEVYSHLENENFGTREYYSSSNYYSDKTIAENNARADKLMRQLRRFAVEHRKEEIDWNTSGKNKYYLFYSYNRELIKVHHETTCYTFGTIYFDSEETAKLAIKTFRDELIWYFTEYKDSL